MSAGKVILITGTSSGFGRLTAETLARQGHTVYASMRAVGGKNAAAAQEIAEVAAREKVDLRVVELDVSDDASIDAAVKQILDEVGHIDAVVNNAGVSSRGPLEGYSDEQVLRQFDTNVFSVVRVNRAVLPSMRARGEGLLIQLGSVTGRVAVPFMGLYSASKFALEGLTEAYQRELVGFGVEAAIIEAGTYPTEIKNNAFGAADSTLSETYSTGIALTLNALRRANSGEATGTVPNPQDVADAIAQLIALPSGSRPLRTVVAIDGQHEGPEVINEASERGSQMILTTMGISTPTVV